LSGYAGSMPGLSPVMPNAVEWQYDPSSASRNVLRKPDMLFAVVYSQSSTW